MNLGVIVQARMGSRRMPGKVLSPVAGKPLLHYLLERLNHSRIPGTVVVATSSDASDQPVEEFCRRQGVACQRGSVSDVAGRFAAVVASFGFDSFVRLCGDSPLVDPQLIRQGIAIYSGGDFDVVTNIQRRTFPSGQSVEVLRTDAFRKAYARMTEEDEREHVTPYFYKHAAEFRIHNFVIEPDLSSLRTAVDTPADFEAFATVVQRMDRPQWTYGLDEVVKLYREVRS